MTSSIQVTGRRVLRETFDPHRGGRLVTSCICGVLTGVRGPRYVDGNFSRSDLFSDCRRPWCHLRRIGTRLTRDSEPKDETFHPEKLQSILPRKCRPSVSRLSRGEQRRRQESVREVGGGKEREVLRPIVREDRDGRNRRRHPTECNEDSRE